MGEAEDPNRDEEYKPITDEEVTHAMKAMKHGKAAGDDGIQVELLKAGRIELVQALLGLFNRAFELEEIP